MQALGMSHVTGSQVLREKPVKAHRWYFGGVASAGAALFTHPLDLLKARYLMINPS